jgi:phospholipid-binding lipoprotein MlaA
MLSACATSEPGVTRMADLDRMEEKNRQVHEFNKKVDKTILGPSGRALNKALPEDIATSVDNFVDNLGTPADAVNSLLQGDLKGTFSNTLRFAINTTLGFGGLFNAAGDLGVHGDQTDFGETLHVWGFAEGDYL